MTPCELLADCEIAGDCLLISGVTKLKIAAIIIATPPIKAALTPTDNGFCDIMDKFSKIYKQLAEY